MNGKATNRLAAIIGLAVIGQAAGQDLSFTSQFSLDECHFSVFGGQPHFVLNPGHRLVLRGEESGQQLELAITPLNATKEITLSTGGQTRKILTRVVEERESLDGELAEVARFWYARCLETGDVFYFGEEVDFYEGGVFAGSSRLWEAGVDGAAPGLVMPRTFLVGARYYQNRAPGFAVDQAENVAMGLSITTPDGTFENGVRVRELDVLRPENEPSLKTYAPGVGLVSDDDTLRLEAFLLGAVGLPSGGSFVASSSNPFLPLSPGRQLVLEGDVVGQQTRLTISVLDEVKEVRLEIGGETRLIQTRVVEERRTTTGELREVARRFLTQCLETGDVWCFGKEVDRYAAGQIVGHSGAWLAGVDGAQPGLVMPGHFAVGAQYSTETAPGVAEVVARTSAAGVTSTVPAGTLTDCVTITETDALAPGATPVKKTYAPGLGLVDVGGVLKLAAFTIPDGAAGLPVLSAQDAVLLTWPLTDDAFRVEQSSNLTDWVPLPRSPLAVDGRNQVTAPRDAAKRYFRLTSP